MREAVSAEHLQAHLEQFNTMFRDSGSEDEWKAARYIAEQLSSYGVENEIYEFDSLISWPMEGKLAVLDDQGKETERILWGPDPSVSKRRRVVSRPNSSSCPSPSAREAR